MPSTDYLTYGYAALVASGGVMGYVKKGSIPSLAAGLLFGAVIGLGAYHTSQDPKRCYVALGASAALTVFMGKRFLGSGKIMPAGLVAGISLLMLVRFSARVLGLVQIIGDEQLSMIDTLSTFAGAFSRHFAEDAYIYGVVIIFGEVFGELAWTVGDFCIALASVVLRHYYERLNRCGHLIVEGSVQEMEELCRSHFLVSHLVQEVHRFFSPLILVTVGLDIVYILTALFCGLEADLASPRILVRISFALTFSFLVVRVATSTYLAACVPEAAQKTMDFLLARRVFENSRTVDQNRQRIIQLDLMLQQILDEAADLGGSGFFTLNKSYAAKLFSVVVTYEIIMLQFPH